MSRAPGRTGERTWWGNPLLWLAVGAISLVLGFLVFPHFFGGVVLFLPFVWLRRPHRDGGGVDDGPS